MTRLISPRAPEDTRTPGPQGVCPDADQPSSQNLSELKKSFRAQRILVFKNATTFGSISASRHSSWEKMQPFLQLDNVPAGAEGSGSGVNFREDFCRGFISLV